MRPSWFASILLVPLSCSIALEIAREGDPSSSGASGSGGAGAASGSSGFSTAGASGSTFVSLGGANSSGRDDLPEAIASSEAQFFQDFESGDYINTTEAGSRRIAEVVDELAYRGSFSFRVQQEDPGLGNWGYMFIKLGGMPSNVAHLRSYVFFPEGGVDGGLSLLVERSGGTTRIQVRGDGSVEAWDRSTEERTASAPGVVPFGRWWCFQAYYYSHPDGGEVRVWVDEQLVLRVTGVPVSENVDSLSHGMFKSEEGTETQTVYVDDVAADRVPIRCD